MAKHQWKKGQVTNPAGRPKIILPEVQTLIDQSKNDVREEIIRKVNPKLSEWVDSIIALGIQQGDAVRFKILMDIAIGKLPADNWYITDSDERALILEYRRRIAEKGKPGST